MPIYEYVCADCGHRFDRLQPSTAPEPACPSCGTTRTRRAISLIAGLSGAPGGSAVAGVTSGGCGCGGACACGR